MQPAFELLIISTSTYNTKKLSSIEDWGQTDRVTMPMRALDAATAANLGRATPHASWRGNKNLLLRQSVNTQKHRSRYSCITHFALTLT